MNVISFYIVREVLKGSLVALLCLLTLFNLFTFGDELGDLGKGHYGLKEIFYYITLTSSSTLYELIPASALIGSLFILGNMANNRELTAMQVSGLPVMGIIRAVLMAGAVLVVIAFLIGEFIAPLGERMGQRLKLEAQNRNAIMHSKYGLWLREGNQFINVRKVLDDGRLAVINMYEIDQKHHLRRLVYAKQAKYLGGQKWQLAQTKETLVSTVQMQAGDERQQIWHSSIQPDLFKMVSVSPNNLALYDLAQYIGFLKDNQQKSLIFEQAFWGRIVNPLVTFVMLLVAVPFVIGIKRGISFGARVMVGVIIGMGFNILDRTVSHLGLIYELNPALVAFLPSLMVLLIALMAIKKAQYQ